MARFFTSAAIVLALCLVGAAQALGDPAYRLDADGLAATDVPADVLKLVEDVARPGSSASVTAGHGSGRFTVRLNGEGHRSDFYLVRRGRSGKLHIVPTELDEAKARLERIDAEGSWSREAKRARVQPTVRSSVSDALAPRESGSYRATLIAPGIVEVEDRASERRLTITRPGYVGAPAILLDERPLDSKQLSYRRALKRYGLAEAEYMHDRSIYKTDRFLDEYKKNFGARFARDLDRLRASDHWIDLGAGHAVAQRGYEYVMKEAGRKPARRTAVALTMPPPKLDEDGFPTVEPVAEYLQRTKPKDFRFVEGRVESMTAEDLGSAQLITDHHGAFYYSRAPDRVLERALSSLTVGGRFYAIAPGSDDLGAWLADLQGAKVVETGQLEGQSIRYLIVEKTAKEVKVPRVRLDDYRVARFSTNDPVQRKLTPLEGKYVRPLETVNRSKRSALATSKPDTGKLQRARTKTKARPRSNGDAGRRRVRGRR